MAGSVRVLFDPVLTDLKDHKLFVERGTLRLSRNGKGATLATISPQPAALEFSLAYVDPVRGSTAQFKHLATLGGQIKLRSKQGPAVFTFDPQATLSRSETDEPPARPPRSIQFEFSSDFQNAPVGLASQLVLPEPETPHTQFAELGVALSIASVEEAGIDSNDPLDIVLGPRPVKLRLKFPQAPDDTPTSVFVLRRVADGAQQTRRHSDDVTPGDATVDLEFENVLEGQTYTLTMRTDTGHERTVFRGRIALGST